jgi:L-seryl-tRNA(Ser) seleniumtransferase
MAIPSRLPQLPSLGELLEHPRVKGLVARVNRSTLAQRAGGFLDEVRASISSRAEHAEAPSLAHLAERLARRLLGEPRHDGPVINATGLVLGDPTLAPPLPETALHAMVQLTCEYHRTDSSRRHSVERSLCEVVGAEAALVTSSLEAALMLAFTAIAGNNKLTLYSDAMANGPIDWPWLAARTGVILAPPSASVAEGVSAIVRAPDAAEADSTPNIEELASQARSRSACLIDVAPVAGTIDPGEYGFQPLQTVQERLSAGAEVVIVDGAGLLGGPGCGLVIGRRAIVDKIAHGPLASLVALDPPRIAALDAVLQLYRDDAANAVFQVPIWQLLSAPHANLQQRAQRLAALMGECATIAHAECRAASTTWRRWGAQTWHAESWIIELRPKGGDAAGLAAKLAHGPNPIVAGVTEQFVQMDLRSVFPRWDQQLVAAVDACNSTASVQIGAMACPAGRRK